MERIKIRIPFRRYLVPALISVGGSIVSAYLIAFPPAIYLAWIGIAGMLIGVLVMAVLLWSMLDFRARIVMGPEGITEPALKIGPIPWSAIRNVKVKNVNSMPHLCLTVDDPSRFLLKASWFARTAFLVLRETEETEPPPISINLVWLEARIPEILHHAQEMKSLYGPPDTPPDDVGSLPSLAVGSSVIFSTGETG